MKAQWLLTDYKTVEKRDVHTLMSVHFLGVGEGGKKGEEDSEMKGDGFKCRICTNEVQQMEGVVVRSVSLL